MISVHLFVSSWALSLKEVIGVTALVDNFKQSDTGGGIKVGIGL